MFQVFRGLVDSTNLREDFIQILSKFAFSRSSQRLTSCWFAMYKPTPTLLPVLRGKLKNVYPVIFKTETLFIGCRWVSLSIKISMVLLFPSKSDTKSKFLNKPGTFWWSKLNLFMRSSKSKSFGGPGIFQHPHTLVIISKCMIWSIVSM